MTIPDDIKQPLLRSFHKKIVTPRWNFNGNGPDEKDRVMLVAYHLVVEELLRLDPMYAHLSISLNWYADRTRRSCHDMIVDICHKMETGMADFTRRAALSPVPHTLETIEEYDLYCHYVASLVGEGLSRLFSTTGKESQLLA